MLASPICEGESGLRLDERKFYEGEISGYQMCYEGWVLPSNDFSLEGVAAVEQAASTPTLDENDIAIAQDGVLVMQPRVDVDEGFMAKEITQRGIDSSIQRPPIKKQASGYPRG